MLSSTDPEHSSADLETQACFAPKPVAAYYADFLGFPTWKYFSKFSTVSSILINVLNFRICWDSQKSCENSTVSSNITQTQVTLLTSYIGTSQLMSSY